MRVFLDTNVLVSGFASKGFSADVVRLVLAEHELVTAEVVLEEVFRVLSTKFKLPPERTERVMTLLREHHVEPRPQVVPLIPLRDRTDVPVLASAIAAGADVLVTGDKDLLVVADQVEALKIMDPRSFWTKYHGEG